MYACINDPTDAECPSWPCEHREDDFQNGVVLVAHGCKILESKYTKTESYDC